MYYKEPTEAAPRDLDLASTVTRAPPDYRISGSAGTPKCDYRTSSALQGTDQFIFSVGTLPGFLCWFHDTAETTNMLGGQ